ncbi:AF4/FMR2 family member 4 [Phyllostomus discolor]|uniref:AF4/FMR2 family member 4 n=1 Tax=Phyllostomus discolor TaxID=89673 RepID=A0A834DER1_9CHIR|nr:AF4/FMR2 family member 4 [Phyllostomus discolor]
MGSRIVIRQCQGVHQEVTLNLHTIIVKEQITPGMIPAATAGLKAALDRTQRVKAVPATARPMSPRRVHLRSLNHHQQTNGNLTIG